MPGRPPDGVLIFRDAFAQFVRQNKSEFATTSEAILRGESRWNRLSKTKKLEYIERAMRNRKRKFERPKDNVSINSDVYDDNDEADEDESDFPENEDAEIVQSDNEVGGFVNKTCPSPTHASQMSKKPKKKLIKKKKKPTPRKHRR